MGWLIVSLFPTIAPNGAERQAHGVAPRERIGLLDPALAHMVLSHSPVSVQIRIISYFSSLVPFFQYLLPTALDAMQAE